LNKQWYVDKANSNPEHNINCMNDGTIQPKTLAQVFFHNDSNFVAKGTNREVVDSLKKNFNCSVGGSSRGADVTSAERMGVLRLKKAVKELGADGYLAKVQQMESLLSLYKNLNKGSFTDIEYYDNNTFRRLAIIPQNAVSVWKSGFARPLISLDGGFWKETYGKKYKLIVYVCSTGDNSNQTLVWIIADGETAENISYGMKALEKVGIILNDKRVATISDEGSGIWKAFRDNCQDAFHMLCSLHWLDNCKGWGKGTHFNDLICADTQAKYDAAMEAAQDKNPTGLLKLMQVQPLSALIRYHRLQGQQAGTVPATSGKVASYCEQEQSKYLKERKLHPADSIVEFSTHASVLYAKTVEKIAKIMRTIAADLRFLTPHAATHYESVKQLARQVTVNVIHFEEGLFTTYTDRTKVHRTNFVTRACSDCNCYVENLQPCHHLIAIYTQYKGISTDNDHDRLFAGVNDKGEKQYIRTSSDALSHLYGRCYWMSTMVAAYEVSACAPVVPVSYEEAGTAQTPRALLKAAPTKGRPRTKRIQSSWDQGGKGTKPPAVRAQDPQHQNENSPPALTTNAVEAPLHDIAVEALLQMAT
jgi:hypothetical protein